MKETLPIDATVPAVLQALREGPAAVLQAPPGAGKTTRVPPALLDLVEGEVVVLEPRRIAARTAARRVAQELDDPGLVGWQVRFERSGTPRTRLWYVTEGILARRILEDPQLPGVGALVLDEFHERHLPGDLSLALAQRLLPRIRLLVMSATLDEGPLAARLGAKVITSEGRRFPVEIEHLEKADPRRLEDQVAAAARRLTAPGSEGDVLAFLPGAAEIRRAAEACAELAGHRKLLIVPLHGDLPAADQDLALAPAAGRKLILSTNVAETSVTVPGVSAVIDSGLVRLAAHSPWSGLPSLTVAKISRASAAQRAGRAGRLGPGKALRLYTRHDFEARPEHHPPEIERLDLAGMVLDLRAAGIDPDSLPWLDPPPPVAVQLAGELLRRLGAIDEGGRATETGRACARLPLHPRLSRLVVEAARRGFRADGCTAAALLNEGLTFRGAPAPTGSSDVIDLLDAFDPRTQRRAAQARAQLLRLAPDDGPRAGSRDRAILVSVLAGFPDRVAKRRGAEVLLASGGAAQLAAGSAVRQADLLVAVEAEERRQGGRSKVLVRVASAIEPDWLLDLPGGLLRAEAELAWEPERQRVESSERLLYGRLVLEESRRLPNAGEAAVAARILLDHAKNVPDPEQLARLRARIELVRKHCPGEGIEPLDEPRLRSALEEAARGLSSLRELEARDILAGLVPAGLDRLAPQSVTLPGGRKVRVEYAEGQPPAIRSRLQDFFGMGRGPSICGGRLPLTLHLLAPSGRAQQVTQDLAGFWERHYPAIRKELMRRYPKHSWPENGATAQPPRSMNRRP
ncbi:MAG TPA: ATP-dependent helicase HrpB [Myxococcales bacterium]|nr:ATP-dependent helicase HrpB [Myxococcales bacterium]